MLLQLSFINCPRTLSCQTSWSVRINYSKKPYFLISNWTNISSSSKVPPILFRIIFSLMLLKKKGEKFFPTSTFIVSFSVWIVKCKYVFLWRENSNIGFPDETYLYHGLFLLGCRYSNHFFDGVVICKTKR